jgi:hypothetical protein
MCPAIIESGVNEHEYLVDIRAKGSIFVRTADEHRCRKAAKGRDASDGGQSPARRIQNYHRPKVSHSVKRMREVRSFNAHYNGSTTQHP